MQASKKENALTRSYGIGLASLLLLMVTVSLGAYLGIQTRAQFREIAASWSAYSGDADKKGIWISSMRGYLGYGGIIHHFKNYVLRQDPAYLQEARSQLARFDEVIKNFLAEPLAVEERTAVETIAATIREYEAMLPVAIEAAAEGWEVSRTDRLVKVDDTAAINALGRLETIWQANRRQSTERIIVAVAQGQSLIWIGFLSIFALVLAALALGYLLVLLLRDMRRAMARLADELATRSRLEESEGRLAEAVEQSPATIFITDTDARILYANRRFEEITGWERAEVEGRTPRFLQSGNTPPEVYRDIRERLARGETWNGVFRNRRKDGGSYWAETTILPLVGPDGAVQNYIGIAEDVTEKRRAREQVVRAQKLEAVGLLAGGIAHDFTNILTTIIGAAHLAALDAPEGSEIAGEIEQIDIAARRAQSLVRELLTFARREPGRSQPTDLNALMLEVSRLLRASIPPTVKLRCCDAPEPVVVLADPTHLHQILMNLCRNAAEAIGGAPGTISVTAAPLGPELPAGLPSRRDGWVRLDVTDDGPGMSAETQRRLFDPFFTTKPLGKGSGLGLAVVSGLVEEIGGQISVESSPGHGAHFAIFLPGAKGEATAIKPSSDVVPRGSERLMLIDDETEIAGTFRRMLMRLGYQVEAFTSPLIALERFRLAPAQYDLLITDMVMPDMSGEELAAAIRAVRPDLPVIVCTGYNPAGINIPGPAPERLDKPVDPTFLARRVRAMLDTGTR